ncbi:MAG: class I SAM-dependent methyltransferase [Desmonostoc vinosum HA7617-LM4]|nr:class I SAM-dependent methyltransferase [Desmonostoc vinosum HA7617-LM4]
MKNFEERKLIKRRDILRTPIHHPDFFVLLHLKHFIHTQIQQIIKPGMRVGDIGCGEQPLRHLIDSCGGEYVGIDVIQNAKETVDILADISSIPLPEGSFDVIVCTEVLEHSFEPQKALQELSRLLKPSGAILITTPFAYPLHEIPYDFSRITPFYIEYWFPKLGLKPPDILSLNGNELEVIATVWGNIWRPNKNTFFIVRVLFAILRSVMNVGVFIASKLFQPVLPGTYFLNIGLVAYKATDSSSLAI